MASEIMVYMGGTTPAYTVSGASISGTIDGDGQFFFTPPGGTQGQVSELEGRMGSDGADDLLVLNLTPQTGVAAPTLNDVRVSMSGAGVSSKVSLDPVSGLWQLKIETPATSGQWAEWEFGDGAPAIKLKVKIVRV